MLIQSHRHRPEDLELWAELERADLEHGRSGQMDRAIREASRAVLDFAAGGPCYVGVSWGKDSVVVASIVLSVTPQAPLCWIRVEPIKSPECTAVRDEFLRLFPDANYHEFEVQYRRGDWRRDSRARGTLDPGIKAIEERFGPRRVLGIRAAESAGRALRVSRWGLATERACAPLGRWSAQDVMAYLAVQNLPVHPAYAMLGGGRWSRGRIRVASLGGRVGDGMGRAEWEQEYYGDVLRRMEAEGRSA